MIRTLAVAAALTTTLALAGCSDDDSDKKDDSSESSSAPASESPSDTTSESPSETTSPSESTSEEPTSSGSTVTGTGYTFDVPEGWSEQAYPEGAAAQTPDAFAANGADNDGFTDNVNVLLSPVKDVTEEMIEQEFAAQNAKVNFEENVTISGSDSLHATTTMTVSGVDYDIEQFYPADSEGQVYVVTFSFSPELPQEDRDQVIDQTLGTWTWTN